MKEKIVGWYTSKSTVSPNDLDIHRMMRQYNPNPVFITTDVDARDPHEIPVSAYIGAERVRPDGQPLVVSFQNVPTIVDFLEVEEVGVEQLLRDIKDVDVSEIGTTLTNSVHGLAALEHRLKGLSEYLQDVVDGNLPVDNEIIGVIQSIFNLLPNLTLPDAVEALAIKSEDSEFLVFVSQLCRSVVSLHELVNHRHPPLGETQDGKALNATKSDAGEPTVKK
jgi:26S proteasome regulatory subunit N8